MVKRVPFNKRYQYSLPVHPISVPDLVPHNPISWIHFLYSYFSQSIVINKTRCEYSDGIFLVHDPQDMMKLWSDGFFGKGTFSRSEATWDERTKKRLGLGEFKTLSIEEITSIRRDERKKFKQERLKLEAKQADLKKKGIVDPMIEAKLELRELRDKDIDVKLERETYIRKEEDGDIIGSDGELKPLEKVQLQPTEVFFLKFALSAIDIITPEGDEIQTDELLRSLWSGKADDGFILEYIAYHHYRSLGWCVRSGIKFGTDFLLYKRGPPFTHAEFALLVLPNYKDDKLNESCAKSLTWYSNISRVAAGVRKSLVLVYVDVPEQSQVDTVEDVESLLKLYKISEVLYRRWVPNKNRD